MMTVGALLSLLLVLLLFPLEEDSKPRDAVVVDGRNNPSHHSHSKKVGSHEGAFAENDAIQSLLLVVSQWPLLLLLLVGVSRLDLLLALVARLVDRCETAVGMVEMVVAEEEEDDDSVLPLLLGQYIQQSSTFVHSVEEGQTLPRIPRVGMDPLEGSMPFAPSHSLSRHCSTLRMYMCLFAHRLLVEADRPPKSRRLPSCYQRSYQVQ
jgi:hypothetical protein